MRDCFFSKQNCTWFHFILEPSKSCISWKNSKPMNEVRGNALSSWKMPESSRCLGVVGDSCIFSIKFKLWFSPSQALAFFPFFSHRCRCHWALLSKNESAKNQNVIFLADHLEYFDSGFGEIPYKEEENNSKDTEQRCPGRTSVPCPSSW